MFSMVVTLKNVNIAMCDHEENIELIFSPHMFVKFMQTVALFCYQKLYNITLEQTRLYI